MNDPTRIQSFSQVFGSDIRNHDYGQENRLLANARSSSDTNRNHKHNMTSSNKVTYKSSRISMASEATERQRARISLKPKTNWQDLIPPMPENDLMPTPSPVIEQRKSKPPPSLQEFKNHGLELPDAYKPDSQNALNQPHGPFIQQGQLQNQRDSTGPYINQLNSDQLIETHIKKPKKVCAKCGSPIAGQFVRAMGMTYHIDCFRCAECNKPCSSKFFPSEHVVNGEKIQVPLCEYDYFKKLDLICYNCNQALRGSYITAIGHKYHLEHFTCVICSKVFETDESFYEHDKGIYCYYHYSKLFAKHCEGCNTPILKQFIELFRGGRVQQWHPECYMCYKFWNVTIPVECINPSKAQIESYTIDLSLISRIWNTLLSFEEATASCISSMLQFATSGNQIGGLNAAARLVLKIEALFKAFDMLYLLDVEGVLQKAQDEEMKQIEPTGEPNYTPVKTRYESLQKEPRNLSAKLMTYLAFLKKISANGGDFNNAGKNVFRKILSLVTGLAHYLKLIVRYGLHNVLEYNKVVHNQIATDKFLKEVHNHLSIYNTDDPFKIISALVPVSSTDCCFRCNETIEESCIKFNKINNLRWHFQCLKCDNCGCLIDEKLVKSSTFSLDQQQIFCPDCTILANDASCETGFEYVSKLMQIIYISEIALVRVKYVIEKNMAASGPNNNAFINGNGQQQRIQSADNHRASIEKRKVEQNYAQTITDIKRLKSARQGRQQQNKSAVGSFRKSTILNAPEPKIAGMANQEDNVDSDGKRSMQIDNSNLEIHDEPDSVASPDVVNNLLQKEKLTLDDIHRIVAAEETKELIPNAFRHQREGNFNKDDKVVTKYIGTSAGNNNSPDTSKQGDSKPKIGKYYSELSNEEHFIIRHISIIALHSIISKNFTFEKLLELIPTRKQQTFWNRIKGSGKKSYRGPKVFGAPLEDLTERYGVESTQAVGPQPLRIPAFVDDCLAALHQKDMTVEGIFRKNGNIKRLRELTEAINENPEKLPDFNNETQIQLSALMKKFLREMPDPLFTFKLYDVWIESQKFDDTDTRKRILKLVFSMLPRCNRDLLEILLFFLSWVASFSYIDEETGSKMNSYNLATVLAPNILYQKPAEDPKGGLAAPNVLQANTEAGDGYYLSIEVVNVLIESQDEFTTVPEDIMEIYNQILKEDPSLTVQKDGKSGLTSKEIIAKIEGFLKNHPHLLDNDGAASKSANLGHERVKSALINSTELHVGNNAVIDAQNE